MLLLDVDLSTTCRFLHNIGFTRQKLCLVAKQRDEFIHQKYTIDVSIYTSEMFVFLGETGADQRHLIRKCGYSSCGVPLKHNILLARGEQVSGLVFMSMNGLLDVSITKRTADGDTFYEFVQARHLLPQLLPFDGQNPHSVVVMDNCAVHHVQEIVAMIEQVGGIVHFVPQYPPDLNLIEEAFSKVKCELKHRRKQWTLMTLRHLH